MSRRRKYTLCSLAVILFLTPITITMATEIVWQPINPSFVGGNYLNGSWLLSSAQAQNSHTKSFGSTYTRKDPIAQFEDELNRELLDRLATKILNEAFGEETDVPLAEGTYKVGNYNIIVDTSDTGISVEINDGSAATIIEVPYF